MGASDPKVVDSLRLAAVRAKAADRERAAEELRPAFERRLRAVGYDGRAIAHAYRVLTGPGTVSEALDRLDRRRGQSRG